ncbi:MAG: C40 family peptidase [Bacillota bacterium]
MTRLISVFCLICCLILGVTSFALGEQSAALSEINPVTAEVMATESQTSAMPADTPPETPAVTPTEIKVATPDEPPNETPAARPTAVGNQVTPPDSDSDVSRGSSTARSIISCALRLLGSPYRYGGTNARGFDCSGFVSHVFSLVDIKLPRSSREQAKVGYHVDKDKLIPADLVFFKTGGSSKINHVGIYLGDNRFIHSSTTRGIVITSLNDKYYQKAYYGARRVLK